MWEKPEETYELEVKSILQILEWKKKLLDPTVTYEIIPITGLTKMASQL